MKYSDVLLVKSNFEKLGYKLNRFNEIAVVESIRDNIGVNQVAVVGLSFDNSNLLEFHIYLKDWAVHKFSDLLSSTPRKTPPKFHDGGKVYLSGDDLTKLYDYLGTKMPLGKEALADPLLRLLEETKIYPKKDEKDLYTFKLQKDRFINYKDEILYRESFDDPFR